MSLLLAYLAAFGLLVVVAIGVVNAICVIRIARVTSKLRTPRDTVSIFEVDPDSVEDPGEVEFLLGCNEEAARAGLRFVAEIESSDDPIRLLFSCWQVPGTDLMVTYIRNTILGAPKVKSWKHIEVHTRSCRKPTVIATTSEFTLMCPAGDLPKDTTTIVRPRGTGAIELVAVAWALSVRESVDLGEQPDLDDYLHEVRQQRRQEFDRLVAAGDMWETVEGEFRSGWRWTVRSALSNTPMLGASRSKRRKARCEQLLQEFRVSLPDDLKADWIIPAVQDRVRTGSTAPLTRP